MRDDPGDFKRKMNAAQRETYDGHNRQGGKTSMKQLRTRAARRKRERVWRVFAREWEPRA